MEGKIHFYIFTACLNISLANQSQTLIQHHPHLAPMEICKQKFPIMWYFNVLPPLTYCPTNWGKQVVILCCTILFMWWHKDEIWLDGLKISHLKTQTMHVCNTNIKQKGHQFIFTLLLHYTTYIAVIFTYFYYIISILQFKYTWCLLPNTNLLMHLEFLCSNCHKFATV